MPADERLCGLNGLAPSCLRRDLTRTGVAVSGPSTSAGDAASWLELPDDAELLLPPTEITNTPVDPQLELLPTHEMTWPNFERLLVRVAREVEGLRAVRMYGVSGQAQEGIDLVGLDPAGESEAVQGKKYQKFTVGDLDKAVKKYLDGTLPFTIRRLAIGVACQANHRNVTNRLVELNNQYAGIEFELWDRDRLSEMLRNRPDIVREFFGATTAARFCGDYRISPQSAPLWTRLLWPTRLCAVPPRPAAQRRSST